MFLMSTKFSGDLVYGLPPLLCLNEINFQATLCPGCFSSNFGYGTAYCFPTLTISRHTASAHSPASIVYQPRQRQDETMCKIVFLEDWRYHCKKFRLCSISSLAAQLSFVTLFRGRDASTTRAELGESGVTIDKDSLKNKNMGTTRSRRTGDWGLVGVLTFVLNVIAAESQLIYTVHGNARIFCWRSWKGRMVYDA